MTTNDGHLDLSPVESKSDHIDALTPISSRSSMDGPLVKSPPVSESSPMPTPRHTSHSVIPVFYHKLPKNTDALGQKLREEARTLFLQKRSKELLDNNELKALWALLEKNYTQPTINNEQLISYDDYLRVVRLAGDKFK